MSTKTEKIYHKSPYFLKVILLNVKAFINYRDRYSNSSSKFFLNLYRNLWKEDLENIIEYQKNELNQLLTEVYKHSKWYSEIFKREQITLVDIKENPFAVLKRMPLLRKNMRKSEVDFIINDNPKRKVTGVGFTSGTSGSPTKNYIDGESTYRSFALWKRFHETIGIKGNVKKIRFSGRLIINPERKKQPFWVYNIFERQLFMSSYHLKKSNLNCYVKKINRFKPELIDGYPSAISIIASYINDNKIKLDFSPKAIAVTAETLYDKQRYEIEKAFNCKVYNQYASSEGSPFITECINGNLHVNLDSGIFEFLNLEGNPAKPGEYAQLVVTSFRNLKTPLIRYNIEDTVLIPKKKIICSCGCNMPIIEKIVGREDDILWTEEKGYVGRMDTAYKGLEGIVKSQIIQNSPNEVIVNNVIDTNYTKEMERKLLDNLKQRLGSKINFSINILEDIPLGPNGKFDAVKRNFKI